MWKYALCEEINYKTGCFATNFSKFPTYESKRGHDRPRSPSNSLAMEVSYVCEIKKYGTAWLGSPVIGGEMDCSNDHSTSLSGGATTDRLPVISLAMASKS